MRTCIPLDFLCGIANFFEGIWILITCLWVFSAIIFTFMFTRKIFKMIDKRITSEFALIISIFIGYWVYTMVAFLTLASIGIIVILALGGFIALPSSAIVFALLKDWLKD